MAIKQKFQKQGEQTISTFDFSDIFALKGYVKFNAIRTNEGDFLVSDLVSSNTKKTAGDATGVEINFDTLKFNKVVRIAGECYVAFLLNSVSTAGTQSSVLKVRAIRVDSAGNETEIAAQKTSSTVTGTNTTTDGTSDRLCVMLDCADTDFFPDEKFRIEAIIQRTAAGGGTAGSNIFHDPDQEDAAQAKKEIFEVFVPVKVEL